MLKPLSRTVGRILVALVLLTSIVAVAPAVAVSAQSSGPEPHRVPVPERPGPRLSAASVNAIDVRPPISAADYTELRSAAAAGALHVKFVAGSDVAVVDSQIVGLDARTRNAVLAALAAADATIEPLFSRAPAILDAERSVVESATGVEQVDLNTWFRVQIGDPAQAQQLTDLFNDLDVVEAALPEPVLASASFLQGSPNFEPNQLYRDPAPTGVDANYASAISGGSGGNVTITDVEFSWNTAHEDLTDSVGTEIFNGVPVDPFGDATHGTAVLGVFGAEANGFGVTGVAANAGIQLVNVFTSTGQALTNAINLAAANSAAGDVILIEQQLCPVDIVGGQCLPGWLPIEWFPSYYDAIVAAVGLDIHVIEAAGNGSRRVDQHLVFPDSGAIMIGAGNPPGCIDFFAEPANGRLDFSNYGERIDVQSHGACVQTAGSGNTSYDSSFNGTSSAAAIVAGAAASLSSISIANGDPLLPNELRALLRVTGTPQDLSADTRSIGPQPDLRAAIDSYLANPHPAPANDDFFAPTAVVKAPVAITQETVGASVQVGEPVSTCGFPDTTVWYQITPETSGTISFSTSGSIGMPSLALWRQIDPDTLEEVACSVSGLAPESRAISGFLAAGETYLIQVGDTGEAATTLIVTGAPQCDLNGDGFGDVLIGAPNERIRGRRGAGAVNVFYGHAEGDPDKAPILSAASPGVAGAAETGDGFGSSVACGDIDGDGFDDALVGIPGEDRGTTVDAGAAHVFYGSPSGISGADGRIFSQASGSVPGSAEAGDRFGSAVGLGDVNGDGFLDAVIGASGEGIGRRAGAGMVVVLFGSASGLDLGSGVGIHQNSPGVPGKAERRDGMGNAVVVGDITGDGFADIAIGVSGEGLSGLSTVGAVILIPGGPGGPDLSGSKWIAPTSPFVASNVAAGAAFGIALALADLTGDNFADLAVGSLADGGAVDVIPGSPSGFGVLPGKLVKQGSGPVPGASIVGDDFGYSVTIVDADLSGTGELYVGVPGKSIDDRHDSGMFVRVDIDATGTPVAAVAYSQSSPGVSGRAEANDRMGSALSGVDLYNQGYPTLLVGMAGESVGSRAKAGMVNLVPGTPAGLDFARDRLVHQSKPGIGGIAERNDGFGSTLS